MFRPVEVKALPNYRIRVKFSDGVEGEADLSHLVGKGIFSRWENNEEFEKVHLTSSGDIVWDDQIDVCADAIYLEITGQTPEQVFPNLRTSTIDA